MKTLIVAINSKYIHSSLAVVSLKSYCDHADTDREIADSLIIKEFTINDTYDSIIYGIMTSAPDIVAFSCYIWNIAVVRRIVSDIKKTDRNIIIILGGPEVSYGMKQTGIDLQDVDYVIQGEGEKAFFNLLKEINRGKPASQRNCVFINGTAVERLEELPSPYTPEYLASCENRILYYESSRGCPYRCAYCLSSRCGGVRYLSMERVYSDIYLFLQNDIRQVKFVDRTFNCNKKRAFDIFKYIIENGSDKRTNFHFEVGGDLFDDELLELLSEAPAGLIQFEAGIQSTNPDTLEACSRKMPLDETFANLKKLISMKNINIHLDLIVGLPYETLSLFIKSFNDVYSLRPHQLQIGFLKLLVGSPMEEMIDLHGYVFSDNPPYEVITNKYISNNEIIFFKQFEDCFNRYYNSGRFSATLEYIVSFFENSFEMYKSLTEYLQVKDLTYKALSSRSLYDILYEFAGNLGRKVSTEIVMEKLLFDYFSTDQSDTVPGTLRDMADFSKAAKKRINQFMKNTDNTAGIDYSQLTGRYINGKCYFFDYRSKDPVTGRYAWIEGF